MANKQKRPSEDGAAEAEVRPEVESPEPKTAHAVFTELVDSKLKTVQQWAEAKGHIPVRKIVRFRGDAIHSGRHIDVICAHTQWPKNKVVSEQEYDEAAEAAYSISVGEDLTAQKASLEAANERAEAAKKLNAAETAEGQ